MTTSTTMSREEKIEQLAFNVWNADIHSKAYKIAQSKLKKYVQSLLTSRDNEWRERIIRKAISVFRNEVGIEEFEWDGGESKIEDVVKKCLEQMEDK